MNLALTSDFPSTAIPAVLDVMRSLEPRARIAWIPPCTAIGRERFITARALFASYGFVDVSYCDIDEEPDDSLLDHLAEFDVVYLTGGDPIGFRRNILRAELPARLKACLAAGCLVVGASGAAMQLTKNISLFRLTTAPLDEVVATADGAAVLYTGSGEYQCVGQATWFRSGVSTSIGTVA